MPQSSAAGQLGERQPPLRTWSRLPSTGMENFVAAPGAGQIFTVTNEQRIGASDARDDLSAPVSACLFVGERAAAK